MRRCARDLRLERLRLTRTDLCRRFSGLYKEYHNENKAVNTQPPTSHKYLLTLYPHTIERDALLEEAEIEYQYKCVFCMCTRPGSAHQGRSAQARKMYESEREAIEAQYWEARDLVRQRLISSLEDRRRRLREEKEGGDNITESLLEPPVKPRPTRRLPFRKNTANGTGSGSASGSRTPVVPGTQGASPTDGVIAGESSTSGVKRDDLLLHRLLAPSLSTVSIDGILPPNTTSLAVAPPIASSIANAAQPKGGRGARGKGDIGANGDKDANGAAPGTAAALAVTTGAKGRNAGAGQGMVFGKSLAELNKALSASQLEIESDWARMNSTSGRGRRGRAE